VSCVVCCLMVVDYSFYEWVMEFLVRYLGLGDGVLRYQIMNLNNDVF
jgi:hypothetical protein